MCLHISIRVNHVGIPQVCGGMCLHALGTVLGTWLEASLTISKSNLAMLCFFQRSQSGKIPLLMPITTHSLSVSYSIFIRMLS